MSLRSKVVGTLLGVFILFVLAAWLVLAFVHIPAFETLERSHASNQLLRVQEFIESERADVDLLVTDWAEWDDTMLFVRGENDEFYDDNLADGYLGEKGMSFVAMYDTKSQLVWGQAFSPDGTVASLDYLFPGGIPPDSALFSSGDLAVHVSGLVDTAQGPAIVSSAIIVWSSGEGPAGGFMVAGKLLDANRLDSIGKTMLSTIDLLPLERALVPEEFRQAFDEQELNEKPYSIVTQGHYLYTLSLLRNVEGQKLAYLRVRGEAEISTLGAQTLRMTISMLVIAALVLILTLWWVLKGMLLLPIEHLTAVLRGVDDDQSSEEGGGYMVSTMKRLTESRGSISQRNDEIGELISAFDDLSSSLQDATTSVWRIAHLDGLTGLPNRRLIMDRLRGAIANSQDAGKIAVLFIDLDNFKVVNDQLGHEAGDQLLVDVASRIQLVVDASGHEIGPEDDGVHNVVARIGGDEFVVLLSNDDITEYANDIAANIVESIAAPYTIFDTECVIGACVGLAVFPEDGDDLNGILANADAAMYQAKRAGKNTWRRHVPDLPGMSLKKSA